MHSQKKETNRIYQPTYLKNDYKKFSKEKGK